MDPYRVVLIGAGAVGQLFHWPALKKHKAFKLSAIADPAFDTKAKRLALSRKVQVVTNYQDLALSAIDAAIIATPNAYHYPIAQDLLSRGIPVLVEKPVTLQADHYQHLIQKQTPPAVLKSGMVKRHSKIGILLKNCFREQVLGKLKHFDLQAGSVFNWPVQGPGFFDRAKSGGGVLMDNGIHTLDLLFWWLQAEAGLPSVKNLGYYDDACGGIEAECQASIRFDTGLTGTLAFSRMRPLKNHWQLHFEYGTLTIGTQSVSLQVDKGVNPPLTQKDLNRALKEPLSLAFRKQLSHFREQLDVQQPEADPIIPYTLDLINNFYLHKENLRESYYRR